MWTHLLGAQVWHTFSRDLTVLSANRMNHTCLFLPSPSQSWYSFTDLGGTKGWVVLGLWKLTPISLAVFKETISWQRERQQKRDIKREENGTEGKEKNTHQTKFLACLFCQKPTVPTNNWPIYLKFKSATLENDLQCFDLERSATAFSVDKIDYQYRVAQHKPDYLLLLSNFCISTTKYLSMIMYVYCVALKALVKAVLNVSSTGCNNEWQSFAKASYSAIDNVLMNLLPAGLQDFFQFRQFF